MNRAPQALARLGTLLAMLGAAEQAGAAQPLAKAKTTATTFIGTLPAEPPARVAIVIEGNAFLAYACGQTDDFNQAASAWFKGTVKNRHIEATVDGKTLSATIGNGTISGSVTADGREREFTARPVSPNAVAGLYRATREVKGDTLVMGWIVDEKHQVVGGCHGQRRLPIALKPVQPLPPPPPPAQDPPPEQQQQAQELLVQQVDEEPGVAVQGQKVTSAVKLPAGKVVRAPKQKK